MTIKKLHESCAEGIVRILDPLIAESEDDGVHRAAEWVDLLIWNVLVAFVVGLSTNAGYDGLRSLIAKKGHVTRPELDDNSDSISSELRDRNSDVTFDVRQMVARAIRGITRKDPTESHLDEIIKLMRSHLLENDDAAE